MSEDREKPRPSGRGAVTRYWAELALHRGTPATKVASARRVAQDMDTWQSANRAKVPD